MSKPHNSFIQVQKYGEKAYHDYRNRPDGHLCPDYAHFLRKPYSAQRADQQAVEHALFPALRFLRRDAACFCHASFMPQRLKKPCLMAKNINNRRTFRFYNLIRKCHVWQSGSQKEWQAYRTKYAT
jgi:hypothetical protein